MSVDKNVDKVPSRYDWIYPEDFSVDLDKSTIKRLYIKQNFRRTNQIFEYDGLPETITKKDLEIILQSKGYAIIAKVDGKLYAFWGGLGGMPNPYYLPTKAIVANPALKYNATLEIDKECVVMLNDCLYMGLYPLIDKNASLLAECDISFKFAAVNTRIPAVINVKNDVEKESAEKFLKDIEDGKKIGVILSETFEENNTVGVYKFADSANLVQHLIELKQYIIGTFYMDLGIQSSFNMKREAINEAEAGLNTDILFPSIDDMLEQRRIGVEKINKMFGTHISVRISSVWQDLREKQELSIDKIESEIDKNEGDVNDNGNVEEPKAD